jgi:hypothetical protein
VHLSGNAKENIQNVQNEHFEIAEVLFAYQERLIDWGFVRINNLGKI